MENIWKPFECHGDYVVRNKKGEAVLRAEMGRSGSMYLTAARFGTLKEAQDCANDMNRREHEQAG